MHCRPRNRQNSSAVRHRKHCRRGGRAAAGLRGSWESSSGEEGRALANSTPPATCWCRSNHERPVQASWTGRFRTRLWIAEGIHILWARETHGVLSRNPTYRVMRYPIVGVALLGGTACTPRYTENPRAEPSHAHLRQCARDGKRLIGQVVGFDDLPGRVSYVIEKDGKRERHAPRKDWSYKPCE